MDIITDLEKLKVVSTKVELNDKNKEKIQNLVSEMQGILVKNHGVGLSCVQMVEKDPLQLFIFFDKGMKLRTVINPEIIYQNKMCNFIAEECLSLPNVKVNICRSRHIKIRCYDENFEKQELELKYPFSNIALHEIDHLFGKTILDYKI